MTSPLSLVTAVLRWPVESQQRSRRNALVACTALVALRVEREGVEAYLARLDSLATPRVPAGEHPFRAAL